jgi:hypothetical protein
MVSRAKMANILDLVERTCEIEEIDSIIVVTNDPDMERTLREYPVTTESAPDLGAIPFGKKLGSVIEKHSVQTFLYMGGGSGIFMETEDMTRIIHTALESPETILVNNFYSTDYAAFGRDLDLKPLNRCQQDNQIGWILGREERMKIRVLPSNLATRFDLDTPTDLMILKAHPPIGCHLSSLVPALPIDPSPLFDLMGVLVDRDRQLVVLGRIPLEVAQFFDRETACHLRLYIEERGMETRGEEKGTWSLVGLCLAEMGIRRFFKTLSAHANAAIVDSRVLFRHLDLRPSRQDRFLSDLLKPEMIADPVIRLVTEEVLGSSIPCVLGGHTLVSGGLYALAVSAWDRLREPLRRNAVELQAREWEENPRT